MTDAFVPGEQFGSYTIEELIGRGGMGLVYRATETALERPVALKIIAPALAAEPAFRERFTREARRAAAIDHAAIIPIYATGEIEGQPYLVMRYVDGLDLRTLIQQDGRLAPERALAIVHQIAGALDAAHAGGLVHRDVKPANILVESVAGGPERAYLTDFGLTRDASDTRLTQTGSWMGTVDYMPPEQFRGGEIDGRADQYALACVTHELLTGNPPFPREVDLAAMYAHLNQAPPRLTDSLRELPQAVDPVLATAMAKAPAERFSSCEAFVTALDEAIHLPGRHFKLSGRHPGALPTDAPATSDTLAGTPRPDTTVQDGPLRLNPTVTGPVPATAPRAVRPSRLIGAAIALVSIALLAVVIVLIAGSGATHTTLAQGTGTTTSRTQPSSSTHTASTPTTRTAIVYPPLTAEQWLAVASQHPSGSIAYGVSDNGSTDDLAVTFNTTLIRVHFSDFSNTNDEWLMPLAGGPLRWACEAKDGASGGGWECFSPADISPSFRQLIRYRDKKWVVPVTHAGVLQNLGPLGETTGADGTYLSPGADVGASSTCLNGTIDKVLRSGCVTKDGLLTYYDSGISGGHPGLLITTQHLSTRLPRHAFRPPAQLG